jgi:molybdopterin biosynthesis enzyme
VNLEVFVRPAVRRAQGIAPAIEPAERVRLATALGKGAWRRRYVPVRLDVEDDGLRTASVVSWGGSGDVFGFASANALAVIDESAAARAAGDDALVVPLRTVGP